MSLIMVAPEDSWQRRAVDKTCGRPDLGPERPLLGCFVLAILGWQSGRKPPRFGKIAVIDENGVLFSNMQNKDGKVFMHHPLGPIEDVVENFKGLADELKLGDGERIAMFEELRKWCAVDRRAKSTVH